MAIIHDVRLYNQNLEQEISFNRDEKRYNLEVLDLGYIDANMKQQILYNRDGASISNIKFGTRTITLVGWLIGSSDEDISKLRRNINRFFNPKHYITIIQNGYKISGYPSHTVSYGTERQVINDRFCRFLVEFICDNPLFTTEEMQSVVVASWDKYFTFPIQFPYANETMIFGLRRESLIATVDNQSDVPTGMRITLIARGTVSVPRVTNIETQEFIELNAMFDEGDVVVIDTTGVVTKATLTRIDNSTYNILNYITDVSSQSMKLPIGSSSITYSAAVNVNNLSLMIDYSPLFLEVL